MHRPQPSRTEAYRCVVELVSQVDTDVLARTIRHLFPLHPVVVEALRDLFLGVIADVTAWVDLHTSDVTLRHETERLRSGAARVANQPGSTATSHSPR